MSENTEEWGPEYGTLEISGMSGGASPDGVAGAVFVISQDSNGQTWTRRYVADGEWVRGLDETPKTQEVAQ